MSTRDSMRRELKELAKLAETMGKESPADAAAQGNDPVDFPASSLERPMTPASSSRVSVAPFATPMTPPVFDIGEPKKRSGKRTGFIAVVVGASLAAALVGGAYVGRSLAGGPAPVTAAAAMAPPQAPAAPAEVAPAAPPAAAPQAPSTPDPVVPAAAAAPKAASPAAAAAAPVVHKHVAPRPAAAAKAPVAAAAPAPANDAVAAPKPAAGAALGKPKAAAASAGGGDSLEDLIRKEVAGQKK